VTESVPHSSDAAPPPPARPPVGPVFHWGAFLLAALGVVGSVASLPVLRALFGDRLALPAPLADGLSALSAAALAAVLGALAGRLFRRMAAYEVAAAVLLWGAITVALVARARVVVPQVLVGLASQGALVLVLALLGLGLMAAIVVMVAASLAFIVSGAGRLDLSVSYELYIARSHLRLTPRNLGALFAMALTGLLPGILVALGWSYLRDRAERRAHARGDEHERPRMPATMLMTLISVAGVAVGVWTLVVVLSVMGGFSADLKRKILGQTAHGMVLTYGQDEFGDWRAIRGQVLKVRGVTGVTPFLYNEVMLSAGQNVTGAVLKGIDVDTVGTVIDLPGSLESGDLSWLLHPDAIPPPVRGEEGQGGAERPAGGRPQPGIVLGRELARALRVLVGDRVNVISPLGDLGPAGPQPKSRAYRVAAVFYSGMYEYDSKFAYLDLPDAQRFFGTDTVTGLEVKVANVDSARAVMERVVFALGGWPYRAKDWGELNRSLFAALQQEKLVMAVILSFVVLIATFTILATLVMMVLEKRREIAVLKSMGAGVPSIMKIFVTEGVVIGGVGAAFGLLLGLGTCLLVQKVGIPLDPEIYYISNLPVVMDGSQFALVALTALVLSYLATLYPATKAARLHPVDGLRSE
jgi:lipoprotein-releasing system permease protein